MKLLLPYNIDTLLEEIEAAHRENKEYVKRTGLCCECKKNKAVPGKLRCKECIENIELTIAELNKESDFTKIGLPEDFFREGGEDK